MLKSSLRIYDEVQLNFYFNRVPYSASKFAIRGTMESLYVELRQNYPGNQLHLMLVSPFIVETGRSILAHVSLELELV